MSEKKRKATTLGRKRRVILESYEQGEVTLADAIEAAKLVREKRLKDKKLNFNKAVTYRSTPQLH